MAAPVVSAAAAMLIGQQPGITPDTVKARLMKTAYKNFPFESSVTDNGITYTSYYDAFTIGAGYLDIAAALADHEVANLPALSPTANYAAALDTIYMVPATGSLWDSFPTWSDTAVWGSLVLTPASGTSWGSSAMWGSSFAGSGDN
jgi:serine protease AprX